MTAPMPQHTENENALGSVFRWQARPTGFGSDIADACTTNHPSRLIWLDLPTRPADVNRALVSLFTEAMQETSDAKRAGHLLLCLWSPSQYHLDLNELGFFELELNHACRHLMNFIIACQVNFRQIVTHSEMEPVIAAWGEDKP